MNMIKEKVLKFLQDDEGLTTVEYAIAGALVGAAVIGAFTTLGENVGTTVNDIATCLDTDAATNCARS